MRVTYPRPQTGERWSLSPGQVEAARARWATGPSARRSREAPKSSSTRAGSDEAYVIDLLDDLLGQKARRQHRFDWLVGDPGRDARRTQLPVDAFWPDLRLVVEYRERQHDEATPFFDKPAMMTVSGVHRGEQRRRYDTRRDELIPAQGLQFLVVTAEQLASNARGKLKRESQADRVVLVALLQRISILPTKAPRLGT